MRTWLSFLVAISLLGCGSKSSDTGGGGSGGSGGSAAPPPPAAVGTKVFVDNKEVATVTAAQAAAWPRIDSIVPEDARRLGKWKMISIVNAKPKPVALENPFTTYHDYAPALFPGPDGKISFGMFDPVELGKHGKPALQEDGVAELRVTLDSDSGRGGNDQGGHTATDPQDLKLTIKTPKGGEQVMTGDKLLAIPRETMPGGGGDAKGWKLQDVLAASGVKTFSRVRLTDADGPTLTLEKGDLDAKTIPFIKLNRQGSLRFRVYKQQGEGWQPAGDLRSLAMIEVLE